MIQREKFTSPPPPAPLPDAEFMPYTSGNEPEVIVNGPQSVSKSGTSLEEKQTDEQGVPDEDLTQNDRNDAVQSSRKKKSKKKSKRKKQPEQETTLPPLRGGGKLPPLRNPDTSTA